MLAKINVATNAATTGERAGRTRNVMAIVLAAAMVFPAYCRTATAANEITIAGVKGFSEDEAGTVILKEAYRRIGIKLIVKRLPAKTALIGANKGLYDGDLQRIDAIKTKFTNLVQVRPAINYLEVSAFSTNADISVSDWESLRPYRVGIILGMKFAEVNTMDMNRVAAVNYKALFRMMNLGRVDIGILPRVNGLFQRIKLNHLKVRELKPPLARIDLFHYVNRKNIGLVPRLSATIRRMAEQGELAAMRAKATAILLRSAASTN